MLVVGACDAPPSTIGPELVRHLAQIPYPSAPVGTDLDIVVVQDEGEIILANRTARSYPSSYLWINQQYVGLLDQVPIGSEVRFQLVDFINENGEPFSVGGPLTPDKTETVVLAELFTTQHPLGADATDTSSNSYDGKRYRLLVRQYRD